MIDKGWLCPRCEKINSPSVRQCNCKAASKDDIVQKQLAEYQAELAKLNPFGDPTQIYGPKSYPPRVTKPTLVNYEKETK